MVVEVKPELYFLHAPLLQEGDTEMNLMIPWSDIFCCQNQLLTSSEEGRATDVFLIHANIFFKNPFNLLKDKTNVHYNRNTLMSKV
jgi:hypothetical protein